MVTYMKKLILLLISAPCLATHESFFHNEIILKLDAPKLGTVTYGIDGPTIHDILWLLQMMNDMVLGHKDAQNKTIKKYQLDSQPCTLLELYKAEKKELKLRRPDKLLEIQKTLAVIKKDFEQTTTPFMMQVRIFKDLICELIREWCTRTKREDSFLLTWHGAKDDEFAIFHKEINSAEDMFQLMADLKDFLTKLVHSCPRAYAEFEAHKDNYRTVRGE